MGRAATASKGRMGGVGGLVCRGGATTAPGTGQRLTPLRAAAALSVGAAGLQGGGSGTDTQPQGRGLPAHLGEGEIGSRTRGAKAAVSRDDGHAGAEPPGPQVPLQAPFERSSGKRRLCLPSGLLRASPPRQVLGTEGIRAPHPPAQPRRKEVGGRWRKAENPLPAEEMAAAAQLQRLQPE